MHCLLMKVGIGKHITNHAFHCIKKVKILKNRFQEIVESLNYHFINNTFCFTTAEYAAFLSVECYWKRINRTFTNVDALMD